jgi:DNA-binding response OmpR family regulator
MDVAETVRIVFLQRDPLLAETYRAKLELDGYQVTVASPSVNAMEDLRSTPPDIIFLDVSSGASGDRGVLHERSRPTRPSIGRSLCRQGHPPPATRSGPVAG